MKCYYLKKLEKSRNKTITNLYLFTLVKFIIVFSLFVTNAHDKGFSE